MSDNAISINNLGRVFKLYRNPQSLVLDTLGLSRFSPNSYKEFWALRNFDLQVPRGQRLGIIGRNGAGKSTLLKIICGRTAPSEGSLQIYGKVQALLGIGTGFNNELTGRQNIHSALSLYQMSGKEIKNCEEEIVDFTELEDFIDQPVKFYSAGMYTRLAFAVATTLKPEVLIIDEVLGAGDAAFVRKCAERMKTVTRDTGATVLFVSHSAASVIEICDRAIWIDRGQVAVDGDPLFVTKMYQHKMRAEEEASLKAKEYRLRRKDYLSLQDVNAAEQRILFRLVCDTPHPLKAHKIRGMRLKDRNGAIQSELMPGSAMDNADHLSVHLMEARGLNDWGKGGVDGDGTYRFYQDERGQFQHAPFQLSLPLDADLGSYMLELSCDRGGPEPIHVEVFYQGEYRRLGEVASNSRLSLFSLDAAIKPSVIDDALPGAVDTEDVKPDDVVDEVSIYGSGAVSIESVDLLGCDGMSHRSFETGDELTCRVTLFSPEKIPRFVLVFCVYWRDGNSAMQVFCRSESLGYEEIEGRVTIDMYIDHLRLGSGTYMVSIGCFKEYVLTTAAENEAYAVLDRAIFFAVHQPVEMAKDLGAIAHPVEWRSGERHHRYDPALDHREAVQIERP